MIKCEIDRGLAVRIAACAKHFVDCDAAECGRDYNTCEIGEHTLRNVDLPPLRAAVHSGVATVMTAFNEINGVPMPRIAGSRMKSQGRIRAPPGA